MPLSDLHPFEGHPFKVLDDELMEQTVESIKPVSYTHLDEPQGKRHTEGKAKEMFDRFPHEDAPFR